MANLPTTLDPTRSQSNSSSTPGLLNSPASDWELQLAQYLQQVGQSQMQWAQQEYARAGAVTDAQINNYIQTAQQGSNAAGGMLDRYNSLYAPATDQYAREAGTYASGDRIQHEMGRAESGVMQAGRQSEINAEQELQSFGVDPSSGRYQDLVRASKTADAAAAAGAGETARRQVEAEGTRRKEQAIAMGQQLPGASVNALNSAYQGIAGAENSALGLANTGVNLTTSASKFFDPAMGVKYPPVGQTSTSQSLGQSNLGAGAKGGGGGGGGGGKSSDPFNMDRFGHPSGDATALNSSGGRNTNYGQNTPGYGAQPKTHTYQPGQLPTEGGGAQDPYSSPQSSDGALGPWGGGTDPYTWGQGGNGILPTDPSLGGQGPYGNEPAPADWGSSSNDYSGGYNGSSTPTGGGGYSGWDDNSGLNAGSGWDPNMDQSGGADWGNYAQGGVVPASMSPSGGQQTDDVSATIPQTGGRAQINVGEFVLPRDVVAWKGQEFFQKMIKQARGARVGAPAKPQRG